MRWQNPSFFHSRKLLDKHSRCSRHGKTAAVPPISNIAPSLCQFIGFQYGKQAVQCQVRQMRRNREAKCSPSRPPSRQTVFMSGRVFKSERARPRAQQLPNCSPSEIHTQSHSAGWQPAVSPTGSRQPHYWHARMILVASLVLGAWNLRFYTCRPPPSLAETTFYPYIIAVIGLTKQEWWVIGIVAGLLLTGFMTKMYRASHPAPAVQQARP
jgi:hypothetical protein